MFLRIRYLLQNGIDDSDFSIIRKGTDNLFSVIDTGVKKMVILNWFHPCYPLFGKKYSSKKNGNPQNSSTN